MKLHNKAPMIKYHQYSLISCCFSCLDSAFESINPINAENAISNYIEELLTSQGSFRNRIYLSKFCFEKLNRKKKMNSYYIIIRRNINRKVILLY